MPEISVLTILTPVERCPYHQDMTTTQQIKALSDEAGAAGDLEMVAICDKALTGDTEAMAEVERAILAGQG